MSAAVRKRGTAMIPSSKRIVSDYGDDEEGGRWPRFEEETNLHWEFVGSAVVESLSTSSYPIILAAVAPASDTLRSLMLAIPCSLRTELRCF
ncbi:unnamed protein product [Heligmosomoides polygyrus]|uniref:Uncharacterized protein n=1 Tax=Heligmosomoides polygyrus TaxID=6339 RepID=A0A183FVR0_HELPZ|nr:unnamed protein product [Heligmosomoides polygyrus]